MELLFLYTILNTVINDWIQMGTNIINYYSKCFLSDATKHKEIVRQLNFTGAFLKSNFKHRVLVKLESIYMENTSQSMLTILEYHLG